LVNLTTEQVKKERKRLMECFDGGDMALVKNGKNKNFSTLLLPAREKEKEKPNSWVVCSVKVLVAIFFLRKFHNRQKKITEKKNMIAFYE